MTKRIIIRHTSGAKMHQIDEFHAEALREIIAGRDEAADIRFDSDHDDLVSRQHLKIAADSSEKGSFVLSDLQSRNGTFLNRQRVRHATRVHHYDVIQLGVGGPEFRFELDPAPHSAARPTRSIDSAVAGSLSRPTRESSLPAISTSRPIGRATVERMFDENFGRVKKESGKTFWVGVAAILTTVAIGLGAYFVLQHSTEESAKRSRDQQALLLQMAQVVKQQPSDDTAVQAKIDKLSDDLKKIMAQNNALKIAAQKNGNAAVAAANPNPAAQPAAQDYNSGLSYAMQLYQTNDYAGAYAASAQIIGLDGSRWEGYYIAGSSLYALNKPNDAQTMFQYALSQAPDDQKSQVAQRINAITVGSAVAN